MSKLILLKSILKDKNVASVIPTSKKVVSEICENLNFSKDIIVIEYGPGDGIFTKYLLSRMNSNSKIIALETNKKLFEHLKKINDKRLIVINKSAENIKEVIRELKYEKADIVLSGIPFSLLKKDVKERIINDTKEILKPKGNLIVYQMSKQMKPILSGHFNKVDCSLKPFNFPPLFVFEVSN
ncbi:MAG: rRNA adenine N-6-methyltransferase family protein [Candidatus Pacearchaeota archaeon]